MEICKFKVINASVPEALFNEAKSIAENEEMTIDDFLAMVLASQISSWNVGKTFGERAANGSLQRVRNVLANAPNIEAEGFDKL